MTRPTTMSAMTEIPANTPRPMGKTSSFLPGIWTLDDAGAWSLDWFACCGFCDESDACVLVGGGAADDGMLVGPIGTGSPLSAAGAPPSVLSPPAGTDAPGAVAVSVELLEVVSDGAGTLAESDDPGAEVVTGGAVTLVEAPPAPVESVEALVVVVIVVVLEVVVDVTDGSGMVVPDDWPGGGGDCCGGGGGRV